MFKEFDDKEVQLDMAFHDAMTAVMAIEKWIPGADTHIIISKMVNELRQLEDRAREKHFPKDLLHPIFGNVLKNLEKVCTGFKQ